jgi:hypothetical protein
VGPVAAGLAAAPEAAALADAGPPLVEAAAALADAGAALVEAAEADGTVPAGLADTLVVVAMLGDGDDVELPPQAAMTRLAPSAAAGRSLKLNTC